MAAQNVTGVLVAKNSEVFWSDPEAREHSDGLIIFGHLGMHLKTSDIFFLWSTLFQNVKGLSILPKILESVSCRRTSPVPTGHWRIALDRVVLKDLETFTSAKCERTRSHFFQIAAAKSQKCERQRVHIFKKSICIFPAFVMKLPTSSFASIVLSPIRQYKARLCRVLHCTFL